MATDSQDLWLGVDLGTQGVRVVAIDGSGQAVGSGEAPVSSFREGRRHEQDPRQWWTAFCAAARGATAGLGRAPARLSIASTSGTLVVQGTDGATHGPALMYDDGRAGAQAASAVDAGSELWSRLGYRPQPTWALPRLAWLAEHEPPSHGARVVHQGDWLAARLTGSPVATDTGSALKTGYDTDRLEWPWDLLDALGVPHDLLPEVVAPGTPLGTVTREAAEQSSIAEGTVVVAGTTDGCAAQVAAGALAPGSWSSALGTTLVVKGSTRQRLVDPAGVVYCHRNPDGGWLPGGASSTGAGVLARDFAGHDLDALTDAVAHRPDLPAAASYPLIGRGERFPFVAPEARGFHEGPDDEVSRFAGVLYGVAFLERLAYRRLAALGAEVEGPVRLTGGATRNAWWNQLRADLIGRDVELPEDVGSARGAAILAAAEPGSLAETANRLVRVATRLRADPGRGEQLDEAYRRWFDAVLARGWTTDEAEGPR